MGRAARLRRAAANGLRGFGRAIATTVPVIARDLVGLAGAALVAYGVWLIHQPSGYIAAGLMLLAGAWLNAKAA